MLGRHIAGIEVRFDAQQRRAAERCL